jgi:hypothetical protein
MDATGTITWAKDIGGEFNNRANAIIETSDGSLLVSGYTVVDTGSSTVNPIHNPFLMKLDSSGNFQWAKKYGQDSIESRSYSLVENSAGTICLVGETFSFGANTGDAYLIGSNVDGFTGCYESNFTMTSTDVVLTATSIGTDSIGSLAYSYTLTGQPISLNENTVCQDNAVVDFYQSPSFIIYPNPAHNLLTIDLSGFGLSEPVISIYNSLGEIVKSFSGNNAVNLITVENLPKGAYYLNVKTDRNQLTKSFLKM